MHNAGYELITTAPRPRTAVFRNRGNRLGGTTDGRQPPRDPHRLRRRRNRWRVHQRICLGPVLRARAQSSSMSPAAAHVVRIGLPAWAGTRPDSIDHPATRCDAASGMLPGTRRAANRLLRPLIPSPRSAASTFIRQLQLNTGSANGRRPSGTSQETGLRTRRHHQHHDPGAPDQPERHETPDPARSDAVNSRFQHVRQASGWLAS